MENVLVKLEQDYIKRIFDNCDFITLDDLLEKVSDLYDELDETKEELENLKQDMEENYKRVDVKDQYEIYDRDFI